MANYVGGDKFIVNVQQVTAGANLPGKTLVTLGGAVPANGANTAFGVVAVDTASGDYVGAKFGVVEVIATGTVTAGGFVETLQAATFTMNVAGTATASQTGCGVQDVQSANYQVGRALTGGSANDTVLVNMLDKGAPNT